MGGSRVVTSNEPANPHISKQHIVESSRVGGAVCDLNGVRLRPSCRCWELRDPRVWLAALSSLDGRKPLECHLKGNSWGTSLEP